MKNTDCRLDYIGEFNERGEQLLQFVRQDGQRLEVTWDIEAAKLWSAREDRAIAKFEKADAKAKA